MRFHLGIFLEYGSELAIWWAETWAEAKFWEKQGVQSSHATLNIFSPLVSPKKKYIRIEKKPCEM